ncbi:MFS transporter [Wolbachia endosymbiont (group B) of Idaea biselata]|uniref:MFS transporter n=1 Tax=unclassified Wolbachia TaxID=2640676 RepID=UPI003978D2CD
MLLPFLLILSLIAKFIEIDISVPSFPDIVRYFNVPEGTIQLTIAYNFLGICIGGLFFGPLSECYGRRRIMRLCCITQEKRTGSY